MSTTPHLAEITPANLDAALGVRVRPDQEHLVEPVAQSLAEAYVHPGVAWPRLIMDGERAVGFLMAFLDIDWKGDGSGTDIRSGLWRLNIAADEQGRGYGRFAVESVAAEIRRRGGDRLFVTWHPGPDGPENFYLGLGFHTTGETSGDQTVGVLKPLEPELAGPGSSGSEPVQLHHGLGGR
ncbi:GNAT family N-acetyltransferase [Streptomyces sp. SP18BB07]|uniref:GNAT family N-acetyltransferase n=1 Tax=Streptomyces sp. SP18BB07 TaxID=3002522 RepID=UPI002E765F27|nr:GNAT family N-acetyltransferase [Streptomyces sp. SP18BB07]MEE1766292.1 GNAT family N-acetyltransferase [Streptomyces sp. SP18BB07]